MTDRHDLVQRYFDGFRKLDHEQVLSCLTDDIAWRLVGHTEFHGKAEFDTDIENEAYEGAPEITVDRILDAGDTCVVVGRGRSVHKENGPLDYAFSDLFTFRGDLIAQIESYIVVLPPSGS